MQGARRTAPCLYKLFVLQSDPSFLHNQSAYVYPDHRFFFKIARADSNAQSHLFHFRPCIHLLRPVSYSGCVFRGEARHRTEAGSPGEAFRVFDRKTFQVFEKSS